MPYDQDREENVKFIEWKGIYPFTSLPKEAKIVQIVTLFTFLSLSLFFLLLFSTYVFFDTSILDPFFSQPLFSYILLPSLYLNHPFLPN